MHLLFLFAFFFGDWPQLLGPTRNGAYNDTDVAWPSKIVWKKQVGAGFAGPIIADGKVILFHRRGAEEIVEAFDGQSGKSLWTFAYPTTYRDDFGFDEGPRSAPTVADGKIFTCGAEGVMHAIDLVKGIQDLQCGQGLFRRGLLTALLRRQGVPKHWLERKRELARLMPRRVS